MELLYTLYQTTGLSMLTVNKSIMILVALCLLYLAIKKGYEPYLLLPISFGMLLVNLPGVPNEGLMDEGGLLYWLYKGVKLGIYPPMIFLAIGASTDFGPLIANPKSLLLGAAAQLGIFAAFIGSILLGLSGKVAASIGIIGGADGPTAIYLTSKLAPDMLGPIAVAAYSYMALVPVIQPPIIRLLTTKKRTRNQNGSTATGNKTRKNYIPNFSYYHCYFTNSFLRSFGRNVDVREFDERIRIGSKLSRTC